MLLQLLLNGLITGSIYALVALGFALVYNTTRTFHIAYSVLYVFCPYMIIFLQGRASWSIYTAFMGAIFLTIALSLLIELAVYRPLKRRNSSLNIVMVSSIGVMIIVINLLSLFFGNQTQILSSSLANSFSCGEIVLTQPQLQQFFISILILVLFFVFLKFSSFGIKTRAMRDSEILCTVFALDIQRMRTWLFVLSGFFAAVGGGLVALDVGIDPYVGMPMLLNAIVALIIGGVGRFEAPIIGGFVIGVLQALAVNVFSSRWQDAVTFSLLVIFLLLRPQGILGEKQRLV